MNEYKLKDIAKIISGGTAPKENFFDENLGIPFIRAGHLEMLCNGNSINYIPKIKDETLKGLVKAPKDTIVFAKSGMSCMKARVYKLEKEAYIVNHLAGIICDELVEPNYLKYYFKYNKPNKLVLDSSYPSIRLSDISDIRIKLPSNEIQLKVSNILDKAHNLIDKRKEQIKSLDELVKSKFTEMFKGKENFEYIKIENLVKVKSDIVDGPFGSNLKTIDYVNDGVRVIQINNIGESHFRDANKRYITEEKFNSLIKHSVIPGDIVVAKMGEPIGRACIVPNWLEKAVIVADCMKIHPDLNIINTKYLEFLLNTDEVKVQFKKYSQGSTRVRLNLTMLRQIEVLYPPIELQNQFADFVKQVDKLKFEMENSLKELEGNFNSLMQKAFKGELFN